KCNFHFLQSKEELPEENCTMYKCSLGIPIPAEGSTYCVSARGSFYRDLILGDPSEESCIHVPLKQTWSTRYIIIPCAVILSVSVTLTICYGCRKLRKENIKLPKSLVSVIRNLNTDSILESKSEAKYISVISFMPGQSSVNNDEVTSLEVEPQEETGSRENSSEGASSLPPPEAPAKAEEVAVQESTEEVPSDDEENNHKVKESYFISNSSQMDTCSNSSGTEVSDTEIQQTVMPSSCVKFSGYDKPHVPLDMLIDVGEEQPVIAYRPAD
ncbi:INGR1 protein, partial [Rostratula benghalensis]|nr:INGR1 protein [Rostratula benghalensis]